MSSISTPLKPPCFGPCCVLTCTGTSTPLRLLVPNHWQLSHRSGQSHSFTTIVHHFSESLGTDKAPGASGLNLQRKLHADSRTEHRPLRDRPCPARSSRSPDRRRGGRAERRSKQHCRVGVVRVGTTGPRGAVHSALRRAPFTASEGDAATLPEAQARLRVVGPQFGARMAHHAAHAGRDGRAGPSRLESASAEEAARLKSRYSTTGHRYRNPLPAGRAGMPCVTSSLFLPFTSGKKRRRTPP